MSNRLKRLLIVGSSQGCYGGIEAFMIALAAAASTWKEFDVKLCFKLVKEFQPDVNLRFQAEQVCKNVYFVKRGSIRLAKLVAWADVLHIQNVPPDIVFPAYLLSKQILLTVHNRKTSGVSIHNTLWNLGIKLADRRWFNSNFVWNSWESDYKSLKSDCIPTVCRMANKWAPLDGRKGFLFVGRWIHNKGIEEILKAYKQSGLNPTEWPLTILGDGPLRPTILQLIQELGLQQIIEIPGFVDDSMKTDYISRTRWLLAPAKTQEDLGLTPIEARSVGVPSIVTRDGGLPEAGGPAALVAEPDNVDDLAQCMVVAASMSEVEYKERSEQSKSSLLSFIKPLDFYRMAYTDFNQV